MDSDSGEMAYLKDEATSDTDSPSASKRDARINWSSENTLKLISLLKNDCRELWDTKHPLNKGRTARNARHEFLAEVFQTTTDEISRKIHNLRAQFHSELRKIKRRQSGGDDWVVGGRSSWEYFDALAFLVPAPSDLPVAADGVNIAVGEFFLTLLKVSNFTHRMIYQFADQMENNDFARPTYRYMISPLMQGL